MFITAFHTNRMNFTMSWNILFSKLQQTIFHCPHILIPRTFVRHKLEYFYKSCDNEIHLSMPSNSIYYIHCIVIDVIHLILYHNIINKVVSHQMYRSI